MDAEAGIDSRPRRRSNPGAWLAVGLLLAAAVAGFWISRPEQVARLVLGQAERTLGLEIRADGPASYRLRGTPHLVLHGLSASRPGASTPLFSARRAHLSLPWSTLTSRGRVLEVERVELDAPVLDLQELQRWRESRPAAGAMRMPTLTDGLRVTGGEVRGEGWSVRRIGMELPSLQAGTPVTGRTHGELASDRVRVPFDLQIAVREPSADAAVGAAGILTVAMPDWRIPMQVVASGILHSGDAIGVDRLRLGAVGRYLGAGAALPFTTGLAGRARVQDGRLQLDPLDIVQRGDGAMPSLVAHGRLEWHEALALELEGRLPRWPAGWPALPEPIGASGEALPFHLGYDGPLDLSGPGELRLQRGPTQLQAGFRLPRILAWIDQLPTGNPLPPLDGTLSTPRLELAGATLHGVEIRTRDGSADDE